MNFRQLQDDAKNIKGSILRDDVLAILGEGEVNAGDTFGCREELPIAKREDWDVVALNTVRGSLNSGLVGFQTFNWFAKRISV